MSSTAIGCRPLNGYARVSTIAQADDGESLDVQQRVIAGYAQMNDLTVDQVLLSAAFPGQSPSQIAPRAPPCSPS
jgi:putative DNA-invertase from lambdoid prophage Rac